MKKHKIKNVNLDLYTEVLDNGLLVNIITKKNVNNIYVTLSTRYGSFDNEFIPLGETELFTAPLGVAHFLEHKVFEQKNGEEPFAFYTKNGADTNASTSYQKTTYLFSGIGCFEENLNYLLDFVQAPHFTDENVNKEKGIIEQEIKMYDDIPYWKLFDKTTSNAFHEHPLKYSIAGTIDSIKAITKEDLYTCYNTFYHPSNMFLTVVGNIDPQSVIEIIKKNQETKKYTKQPKIIVKEYNEPDNVYKEYDEVIFDVEIPKITFAYKINIGEWDSNRLKRYLSVFFNLKLGSTSPLMERMKHRNLLQHDIETEIIVAGKHILCIIIFESKEYDKVIKEIEKELTNRDILEVDLERKKKVAKSSCVFRSDSIYSIASKVNSNVINYGKVILDEYKDIESFNIEELNKLLSDLDLNNKSIVVLKK